MEPTGFNTSTTNFQAMESNKDTKPLQNLDHCLDHLNIKAQNPSETCIYNQPRWFVDTVGKQCF